LHEMATKAGLQWHKDQDHFHGVGAPNEE
jgi:hypothetical protein